MRNEGIINNMFNIIDASVREGKDAHVTTNSDARNGVYAKVFGPNQEIMDTGWSGLNSWVGLHALSLRWFSNLEEGDSGLIIEYWKKDREGNITLATSHPATWDTYYSDEFGNGIGFEYFSENYDFKIIIKSHPAVTMDKYVAVDYIRIIPADMWASQSTYIYGVEGEEGSIAVQRQSPEIYTVTGDGSSSVYSLNVTIPENSRSVWTVPVVCVLGADDYYANIGSLSSDMRSFQIKVIHRAGSVWSGAVNVLCHLHYFPIIGQL